MNKYLLEIRLRLFIDNTLRQLLPIISWSIFILSVIIYLASPKKAISLSMLAIRLYPSNSAMKFLSFKSEQVNNLLSELVSKENDIREAAARTIIIAWPTKKPDKSISKGILIITFTKTNAVFFHTIDVNLLSEYFHIVLEPSWAGYMDPDILFWGYTLKIPVFVQATEIRDRVCLNNIMPRMIPLNFGASDWVDYRVFHPEKNPEKTYDSAYVANNNPIKRVYRYLWAVKKIIDSGDKEYKALLICAGWGGENKKILNYISALRLKENCEIHFSLQREELVRMLRKAKTNVLLSYKEGSNRSLFESMFCNTPVIALSENIGMNKSYINENTGLLVSDAFIEEALVHMKNNWRQYSPRKWAMNNISPEKTTSKLIDTIIMHTGNNDLNLKNIFIKTNNPEANYIDLPDKPGAELKMNTNLEILNLFRKDSDNEKNSSNENMENIYNNFTQSFEVLMCSEEKNAFVENET